MTAPQIIERALTFRFAQSVSDTTGQPDVLQISLTPLADASSNVAGATFVGGVRTAEVALSDPLNTVVFNLIPSFSAGLGAPIMYRVMWRANITARTFTFDFSMPDADVDFDQLDNLGNIIDGTTYLQYTDLGIAGRVARLNNAGIPETAGGDPVATGADITAVTNEVTAEVVARQAQVSGVRATLEGELASQVAATLSTANAYTNNQITAVSGDITTERSSRINADADLQTQINANIATVTTLATNINATVNGHTTALTHKADLDGGGHVPVAQIPDEILTNAFPVADQAAMLALNPNTVHKGSLAVRPDGVFLLTTSDPATLGNWVSLSTVSSVNNKRGAVTLSASDVGAIPIGGAVALSQVTGLSTALGLKADTSTVTSLSSAVTTIQNDTTIVHTSGGVIPTNLLSSDVVYINNVGQLVKKDGSIIPITGGGGAVFSVNTKTGLVVLTASDVGAIPTGGPITQSWITGLSTTLGAKADLVSGTVPDAQIPSIAISKTTGLATALGNKADLVSGLVPLSQVPVVPQSGVSGLATLISGNQLTSSTNVVNRIGALETAVAGGGGGGGGGVSSTVPFYTSANTSSAVVDFTQVNLHSPWGIDADGTITGTIGTWYYLYTGVRSTDVAYPYITANGHLNLRKWNEAGASDPVYALQSDFATLSTTVGTKANQTDLTALTATVATKATQSALTTLSTTVDTKANQADLNSTNTAVAGKAAQSALDTLTTVVGTKAAQTDLSALTTTVGTKANQSDLNNAIANITTVTTALTTKADLVSGTVPLSQLASLPESKITNLVADLAAKADLTAGKLTSSQVPTNIPQASITGLGTALGAKADLVAGVIPLSQIPSSALPNVVMVANRAALLALTTAQVQYGDFALITATADKGSYILTADDPSIFTNWTPFSTPSAPVTSVNTQTGDVVLTAASVGALASNAAIPQSQVTGLVAQLATYATATALTSGLVAKTTPADVQAILTLSSFVKKADYVASAPIASLAGQQSVDGVLVPLGAIVLTTAQSSSVNNGLWTVNSGAWTRPANFASTSYLSRDTVVMVANSTGSAGGTTNPYTIWQMSTTSGFIDTAANNWTRIAWAAPPFVPTGGNGITVTGSSFALNPLAGGGLIAASGGASVDPNVVARKFTGTVPSGSTVAGITHNLNTFRPTVSIWDTAANTMVLAGVTATSANAISIEFASAPASGQYAVTVVG
jgi:hypothetical protein